MRLLGLLTTLLITFHLFAQGTFVVDGEGRPMDEVLAEVSDKYKIKFSYDPTKLQNQILSKKVRAYSEADFISGLFRDLPFKIQLSGGIYLVVPRKTPLKMPSKIVQGQVQNQSGEPLAFALIKAGEAGAITNEHGYFSLASTDDSVDLQISHIGYQPFSSRVGSSSNGLKIKLEENAEQLEEILLLSQYLRESQARPSVYRINPTNLSSLPSLGNVDVFKGIQLLPGIRATDETSAGLSIRGGTPEQNLVLLDGFTLYHLDHFFGVFSTFNPSTLRNIEVYKGGFGAENGGRISSVIQANAKTGNTQKISGGFGLNLMTVDGFVEGPISDKTTFNFGYRRSFMDVLESRLFKDFLSSNRADALGALDDTFDEAFEIDPYFHFFDFNGKINHRFSNSSVLDFNVYRSFDSYEGSFEVEDEFIISEDNEPVETSSSFYSITDLAEWSNTGISSSYKTYLNPKWYNETTLGYSQYQTAGGFETAETFENILFAEEMDDITLFAGDTTFTYTSYDKYNLVSDLTLRSFHELTMDSRNMLEFGAEYNQIKTDYTLDFYEENIEDYQASAGLLSLFAQHKFNSEKLNTSIGFRYLNYSITGDEIIEPRLSINYLAAKNFKLKGAWSQHHQFLNRMALTPFGNSDQNYWILADELYYPILSSRHFIMGAEYAPGNWTFDIEFYEKQSGGILESEYVLYGNEEITTDIGDILLSGENFSAGVDLLAKYKSKDVEVWASYSLSESENYFPTLNRGQPYPALQDQRHEINIAGIYSPGKWDFSAVFVFGTGRPFTPPGEIQDGYAILYDISRINSLRLPDYHRLDLSAKYNWQLGKLNGQVGTTLFNIYNRRNVRSRRYVERYEYDATATLDQSLKIIPVDAYLLGFTPNFFVRVSF